MTIKIINNHIILDVMTNVGIKTCVFDTGSPITFFFDDSVDTYTINQQQMRVVPHFMQVMIEAYQASIEKLVGIHVDGFIGADCAMHYGEVLIDCNSLKLHFGEVDVDKTHAVPMRNIRGLPIFCVSLKDIVVEAAFDSGAMYSFVKTDLISELQLSSPIGIYEDFNPMLGSFQASLYQEEVIIGNLNLGVQKIAVSPIYDQPLNLLGVKSFIGLDTIRNGSIWLSYRTNQLTVYLP